MISNNLRIFLRAAEYESITEAAERLYISQPAVSKAVRKLEKELGVDLFVRNSRNGIELTEIGRTVYSLALKMEETEAQIYLEVEREKKANKYKLKIGVMPIVTAHILSRIIPSFQSKYPEVAIVLEEGGAREVREMVRKKLVDFGICYYPFGPYESVPILNDKMMLFSKEKLDPETVASCFLEGKGLIFCKRSMETVMENLPADCCGRYKRSTVLQNAEAVIRMAESGVGVGVLSKMAGTTFPHKLYSYELDPPIETPVGVIANSIVGLSETAKAFIKEAEQL